jgi:hypothetical protein
MDRHSQIPGVIMAITPDRSTLKDMRQWNGRLFPVERDDWEWVHAKAQSVGSAVVGNEERRALRIACYVLTDSLMKMKI